MTEFLTECEDETETQETRIRKKYKENYLYQVIFRLFFTKNIEDSERLRSQFKERIKQAFPREEEISPGFTTTFSEGKLSYTTINQFRYFDENSKKILTLLPNALFLEVYSCRRFKELREVIQLIVDEFKRAYGKDITVKGTHLQYVFVIRDLPNKKLSNGLNPFDWQGLINDDLIPRVNFVSQDKKSIFRAMNLMEFNKFDYKVKFQSGLFNSESPTPIGRKEFVLDYDFYNDDERGIRKVMRLVDCFNDKILDLFDASIENGLRDLMEVLEDEE